MHPKRFPKIPLIGIALFVALGLMMLDQLPRAAVASPAAAATATAAAPIMDNMDSRLTPPPTVYPPTQADQGAQVYYQVCMTCHGDRGQGLTEEWRNVLGPPDNDCWHSKCHAPNHPPDGFVFPKVVPAVVSPAILPAFQTAKGLHDYLKAKMPWQAPGYLKPEEYWQLTAYLMRLNGADPGKLVLDDTSAAEISFGIATPPPTDVIPGSDPSTRYYFLVAGAVVAALIILIFLLRRSK